MRKYIYWGACIISTALAFAGCLGDAKKFKVGFRNMGKENIFVINQKIGNHSVIAGSLSYGIVKTSTIYLKDDFAFPETVVVKWRKADDTVVAKTVQVKGEIPKEFKQNRDEIIFNIFPDDTVNLSFEIQTGEYSWEEIDSTGKEVDYSKSK